MLDAESCFHSMVPGARDLIPEPSPRSASRFLLELLQTLSPPLAVPAALLEAEAALPAALAALPVWEFRHLECQRVCWHFPFVCHRFALHGPR